MKKLFSFICIVILFSCSKDVEEPVIFTLTATANPTEGGTVSPTNGQYESGDVATVTATPNAEYVFEKWTGGATGTSSSVSVTMNGNKSVVANFIKKQYPLTVEIEGEGTVTETVIKQGLATDYNSGTIVELTAEPTGDWEFVEWTGDITSTENPVQITIDGPKTVKAKFELVKYYKKLGPDYPSINQSSSTIVTNDFFPAFNMDAKFMYTKVNNYLNANCNSCGLECSGERYYVNGENDYIWFDYNNDNKLDIFGFQYNATSGYGVLKGKYYLIDDVFNDFKISYYDSEHFFAVRMEVNDFNGDGNEDVMIFHSDDHEFKDNPDSMQPLSIAYFNEDGLLEAKFIGNKTSSHAATSFDIDQDGDVDIINFEKYAHDEVTYHQELPILLLNDGNGNFEEEIGFIDVDLDLLDTADFRVDGTGVFDLNNDGYLDIVAGYNQNSNNIVNRNTNIFWGSDSYRYSFENSTKVDIAPWTDVSSSVSIIGVTFIDYNLDGLYDIVTTGYGGGGSTAYGHLSIHKNLGNNEFENVTTQIVENYYWKGRDNHGDYNDMPFPYAIKVIDYDGDGDYDLAPHGGIVAEVLPPNYHGNWAWENAAGSNIYWENVGGQFVYRHDKIDLLTGCLDD